MEVLAAINYLLDNYEKVDPSHAEAPLMHELLQWSPAEIYQFLMRPEDEDSPEERNPQEWQDLVDSEANPVEASKLLIEWVRSRRDGQKDGQAMRQYLASPPDQRQYESQPNSTTSVTQPPAESPTPARTITLPSNGEDEAWESAITGSPYPYNPPFEPRDT